MLPASMMVFLTLSAGNSLLICDFHRLIILSILNISSQSFYLLPLSRCAHSTSQVLSMQSNIWQLVPTRAQVGGTHNAMPHCTLYTFGGVSASWQLISPPRCPNPPNRSSEPVCSRGLLPRPPLSWREDKPRPHRAPHPMSLATVLLLTWPPSLGKPAWIHHMGRKVKKEVYTKSLSGSVLSCSSRFFIFGFWPCHVSQLPNY